MSRPALGQFADAIHAIDAALLGGADRRAMLKQILESALELVGADGGTVLVMTAEGTAFVPFVSSGLAEEPRYQVPREGTLTGRAAAERRAVAVDDYLAERLPPGTENARATAAREALRSILAVPLLEGQQVLGVLNLARRRVQPFTRSEQRLAEVLAGQAAVALRVAELADLQRRAMEEVRAASRAKSEFLASMSHEVRTPLNAILGFTELLQEQLASALSDRQRRYFRNIREAGEHLLGLLNDVLDLSRVEAGRIQLRREVVTLHALLEPVVATTRPLAERAGISFEASEVPERRVYLDPSRIRQVLLNLLSNAVKFTRAGGTVSLSIAVDGHALALSVRDTGIGIPPEHQARVFGAFERLHEGRYEASGTGLGLAVTKRLVELHGGTIDFESAEGVGSTFRVRLPDVIEEAIVGERLLIVEDDPRDADLIAALAAEHGLRSEIVRTAGAAVAAARRDPPRAVVLDLRLPDARGETVLDALQRDVASRGIPVIVVTVEDDEGALRARGAVDHITKPVDRARLGEWLRRIAAPPVGTRSTV